MTLVQGRAADIEGDVADRGPEVGARVAVAHPRSDQLLLSPDITPKVANRAHGALWLGLAPVVPLVQPATGDRRQSIKERVRRSLSVSSLAPPAALGVVLALQAWDSVRLIRSNSAFLDEATYLGAGHRLWQTFLHGGPNLHFPNYFSGAPVVYPILGAAADSIGGLTAARSLSLSFMLIATVLVYASARRLYGRWAGPLAAAAFVTVEASLFLGALATFDALSLTLIALATWIVIRAGTSPGTQPNGTLYLAAPVIVAANATKYASTIFDPVVLAIAFVLVASSHRWRTALRVVSIQLGIIVGLSAALLALGGTAYISGISSTTLFRAPGFTPPSRVLHDSISWVGGLAVLASVAAIGLVVQAARTHQGRTRAALGVVLVMAVFLAPINEARIHTTTSLNKHVGFGAWFGAIVVGSLATAVRGRRFNVLSWRPWPRHIRVWPVAACAVVLMALVPMYVSGRNQATYEFHTWLDSETFLQRIKPLVQHTTGPILLDDAEVPDYYVGGGVRATRWHDTYYLSYRPPGFSRRLVGIPAYTAAILNHYFTIVALDFGAQHRIDAAIVKSMTWSHAYRFVTRVPVSDVFGHSVYVIWRLRSA